MSVDTKATVKALILGIQQDYGHYTELTALLLRQHALLASHDVDGLQVHNEQQTALMAKVTQQAKLRCQQLQTLGLKPDEKGMATLIAKLPLPLRTTVANQWQQLEQLLHQCLRQNDLNGRLLAGQMETIHSLLGQESGYRDPDSITD
ncbi:MULTISPECIES: flagellar protein FlgN [Aeromonas]|jgi:flagella synthesis protein FlgN|uniref:Flagellar protein FlgN n=1 Tax=Aeromonas veronii TaxID=654 RepID=A0A1Q8F2N4_AERVE|nr:MULTISPECIES: flagellar protein FlgN [Aeromonas]HDN9001563.1 flagellar protein FlgN [Aeromonas veronii AMC24]EKP0304230.1 flagellar protein FlgN [Aeromonas veronii]EKP0316450.1 flagellar protein FlgN [Aeromonas veronii]KRV64998.1 flagellar protein [Aeromonas veronii]KRV72205.1 flagellar protein [Aeromonas veronii]